MQRHPVDRSGQAARGRFANHRRACDPARFAAQGIEAERSRGRSCLGAAVEQRVQFGAEMVEPALPNRDGRNDRHAQLAREDIRVQLQPVTGGKIDHVERHHGRQAKGDQFKGKAKVIVEIGGIDHHHQRVRQPLAMLLAEDHVAGHLLVGAGGIKAVRAGQVDQFERAAIG